MRILFSFFAVLALAAVLGACTQEKELLEDNPLPPDTGVPASTINNYVQRAYINLLGRKPDPTELAAATTRLTTDGMSQESRNSLIASLQQEDEYPVLQWNYYHDALLRRADTMALKMLVERYSQEINNPAYAYARERLIYEINRADRFFLADDGLRLRNMTMQVVQRRFADNYAYDQINMGTENFVLSMFEYFLKRLPTAAEKAEAIAMVDGSPAVLFLQAGASKDDFFTIFFSTDAYREGQVLVAYDRYLLRRPTSAEMAHWTARFVALADDYFAFERELLSSDTYAGIQ